MNNNIKKARQLIDCFNKENPNITYTCFGPTGPTGPTGPAGATITVGRTTTTEPGTNASVTNVGTPSNAILDFNIPAGATGPQGPRGIQGPQGIQGVEGPKGDTGPIGPQGIQGPVGPIGPTGPAGPVGPTGPAGPQGNTGPAGPSGTTETNTYGRKYDTSQTPLTLAENTPQDVPLASNGLASGITQETANKLTIPSSGIYKIDYYFSGNSNTATDVTLTLNQNATTVSNATISKNLAANADTTLIGSTINNFNANDKIGLQIEATNNATITPSSDTSAYLNIVKIA